MLGLEEFKPGIYFYCGSAKARNGLKHRIGRHLKKNTKKHWHIDHLKHYLDPIHVWYTTTKNVSECDLATNLQNLGEVSMHIKGFGASDCPKKCFSHLLYSQRDSDLDNIFTQLANTIPDIQQIKIRQS